MPNVCQQLDYPTFHRFCRLVYIVAVGGVREACAVHSIGRCTPITEPCRMVIKSCVLVVSRRAGSQRCARRALLPGIGQDRRAGGCARAWDLRNHVCSARHWVFSSVGPGAAMRSPLSSPMCTPLSPVQPGSRYILSVVRSVTCSRYILSRLPYRLVLAARWNPRRSGSRSRG